MFQRSPGRFLSRLMSFLAVPALVSAAHAGDLRDYYGFGEMEILKLEWELGPLLGGDLNGDSRNDLVVCNNRKARIELLLQKPDFDPRAAETAVEPPEENINDLFGRETAWRFKRLQYPLNVRAVSVALGDFDHDGRLDLAYYSDEGLRVVLQEAPSERAAGALAEPLWRAETRFDLGDGRKTSDALTTGDLNGDGRTDLVLLLRDGYYILLQDPQGRLDQPVRHYSSSEDLKQVDVGDVDGDGRDDLVLLTGERDEYPLRIRLQNPDGSLGPEGRYSIPVPSVMRLCRMEASGRCVIASVAQQSGRFSIHALAREDQSQEVVTIHPLPSDEQADKRDMTCADVDGDGLTDMVVTDPGRGQFLVFRGQSGSGLGAAAVYPGLKDMRKVCAARLGGSAADALVVLSIDERVIALSRFEGGRLGFPQTVPVTGEPQAMEVTDLNGDGQVDLAYVAKGAGDAAGTFFLHSILGLGRPTSRPGPSLGLTQVTDKPQDLLACDIDHDGDTDLIVVRNYAPLLLVRQTPEGLEQQVDDQTQIGLVSSLSPRMISLAALGENGSPALLAARGDFARALYIDAQKGWQVIDQYQAGDGRHRLAVAAAVPALSGQGLSIVAYDDVSGIVSFMDRQDDGIYHVGREINVGTGPVCKILSGHFSSNTASDLVLCAERKLTCIRRGTALELRQIAGFEPTIEDGRFGHFTLGDINSDGVPDVVLCEQNRYHVQILSFDESAQLTGATAFKVFEAHLRAMDRSAGRGPGGGEPRYVLVQDVTGDGRNDLILLVHDRIVLYPQDGPG
jgi:hypothetical protein